MVAGTVDAAWPHAQPRPEGGPDRPGARPHRHDDPDWQAGPRTGRHPRGLSAARSWSSASPGRASRSSPGCSTTGSGRLRCPFLSLATPAAGQIWRTQTKDPASPLPDSAPPRVWAAEIDRARGCTLHIDDVAALPVALQLLLLRDLQFRDYGAAAGTRHRRQVRFILSTSENLRA